MKIITVATHAERYFPCLLQSMSVFQEKPIILEWNKPWTGYGQKLTAMLEFLTYLEDDEVVCFIDAFDCIMLQPSSILEKKFLQSGHKMIVAMDGNSPNPLVNYFLTCGFSTIQGKYINTGSYIGFAGYIRYLLHNTFTQQENPSNNDQQILAQWGSKYPDAFHIDSDSELFLTLYTGNRWTLGNEMDYETQQKYTIKKQTFFWKPTNTYPSILHAPCDGNINPILEELGFTLPPSVENYSGGDHARYLWKNTQTYFPFMWHFMVVILSCLLLFLFMIFIALAKMKKMVALQTKELTNMMFINPHDTV